MSKNLDKFIQQQVDAGSFEPSELDWYKLTTMLDKKEEKKKPFGLWMWIGAAAIVSVSLLMYQLNKKDATQQLATKNNVATANNNIQNATNTIDEIETKEINAETKTITTATTVNKITEPTANKALENYSQKSTTQIKSIATVNSSNSELKATTSKATAQNDELPIEKTKSNIQQSEVKLFEQKKEAVKKAKLVFNNGHLISAQKSKVAQNETSLKTIDKTSNQINVIGNASVKSNKINKLNKSKEQQSSLQNQMESDLQNQLANKKPTAIKSKEQHVAHSIAEYKALVQQYGVNNITKLFNPAETNPRYNPNATYQATTKAPAVEEPALANSTTPSIEPPHDMFGNNDEVKNKFYFLGALSANKQFAPSNAFGFSPCGGFGLSKMLSKKISLGTQILYLQYNGINAYKAQAINKYSFGRKQDSFRVNYNSLTQVAIPLRIEYSIAKVISLQAGVQPTYIVEVHSKIQNGTSVATKENGWRTGFNKLDVMATAGIGVLITPRFGLDLMYARGFTDVTQNNYFNNTNKDEQQRITFGFKYIFKNK